MTTSFPNREGLEQIERLLGQERSLGEVCQSLFHFSHALQASVVGALHVTCADESELECVTAFQRGFAQTLLPPLKFAVQSPFRLANLGGRYEWGAIGIAEDHYQAHTEGHGFKFILVKINVSSEEIVGEFLHG